MLTVECTDIGVSLNGQRSFSIEAWVWLNGMGDDIAVIEKESLLCFGIGHGRLFLRLPDRTVIVSESDMLVTSGGWHYAVVSYDSHSVRFYVDSVLCGTTVVRWSGIENAKPYRIGTNLDGRIRSLRIFTSPLDSDQVLADMFAPVDRTSLCTDIDCTCNPPIDRKRPTQPLKLVGRARVVESVPAVFMEGTAYIQPAQSESINPGGGQIDPYTIQASFYATGNTPHQTILVNGNHDTDSGVALYLSYETSTEAYRVCALRGADFSPSNKLFSKTCIKSDTWVNLAVVHDGQKASLYIDGALDAEAQTTPILLPQLEGRVLIGGMTENGRPTGTNTLQGYIRRIDIWNTALSAEKVKAYCSAVPEIGAEGLVESFDLTNEPLRGIQADIPLALCDGAKFRELTFEVQVGSREAPPCSQYDLQAQIAASPDAVRAERQKLDLAALESRFWESYDLSKLGDPAELVCLLGSNPTQQTMDYIARRMEDIRSRGADPLLAVTHYVDGTDWVLVAHYRSESMAVGRFSLAITEECIIYIIKLIFTLIGGAIAVLFGIKVAMSTSASNFIRNFILPLPFISVLLGKGEDLKATDLFVLGKSLHSYGLLRGLVRELVVGFGFWAMLSLLARVVLTFLGVGLVDTLASLVATVTTFSIEYISFLRLCSPPPTVSIRDIMFNHSNGTQGMCSLNICRNANLGIRQPEWINGNAANEPAAYVSGSVNGSTIRARFVVNTMLPYTAEIQATAAPGNPFGNLGPQNVSFIFYNSNYTAFTLLLPPLANLGVGKYTVIWNWEFRETPLSAWKACGTSQHTIYLLQGMPIAPWNNIARGLAGSQCVWSEMLELSSSWLGAGTVAAGAVLPEEFTLGIINCGAVYEGHRHGYISGVQLRLTQMMADIQFAGMGIECSECATLLAIVNALWGSNTALSIFRFDHATAGRKFTTSQITAIGIPAVAASAAPRRWNYHMIASAGLAVFAAANQVYDCCLRLSGDLVDPWTIYNTPFAPGETGHAMVLGVFTPGIAPPYAATNQYLDRLFALDAADRVINNGFITIITIM